MRVGIDASNLRAGGGVTHIVELLRHAEPSKHGITRVTIWSNAATRERIEDRPWLDRVHEPMLDGSLLQRVLWQRTKLAKLARASCDVLFAPGGSANETFHPSVTMSQNMLPFDPIERARYGTSRMHARLLA
ncbi:MAG TPA: glycosyltransferase family 1 protein, partial [Thermoanaerobaculia bacterium]|nr:glycosyltransferase family 1 protein [Thermoanaerobaculia bacterium]